MAPQSLHRNPLVCLYVDCFVGVYFLYVQVCIPCAFQSYLFLPMASPHCCSAGPSMHTIAFPKVVGSTTLYILYYIPYIILFRCVQHAYMASHFHQCIFVVEIPDPRCIRGRGGCAGGISEHIDLRTTTTVRRRDTS